eukprot:CAMPEP_0170511762 /NCGR_PEP_ID=MMETSP0208-20121228/66480_1 /TAXON_ID=197538 /ORGANISM="Strombidium inclinatum, Strain S3" /LENGTH=74 /DNA_ID=CAMNT_0010795327 /DNA_START=1218 /DNA_END=1442 /DNA_ORIENTATION=-
MDLSTILAEIDEPGEEEKSSRDRSLDKEYEEEKSELPNEPVETDLNKIEISKDSGFSSVDGHDDLEEGDQELSH